MRPRITLALALSLVASPVLAGNVPDPTTFLGFRIGEDRHLVRWTALTDYFHEVDRQSDRVIVRELGRSTEERPFLAAIISSPETIRNIDHYRQLQHQVSDPRLPGSQLAVSASKPVVLITCSIHSIEVASTLTSIALLHQLATRDDATTHEILDKTILLLVPSCNPDGVDIVYDWYERSKGHAWEGEGLPWLYHKYAGHDTNRDFFMLNLEETKILSKFLYEDWFPTITYDIHQMGSNGARIFVPPFFDPVNPNIDARLTESIALLGSHMALDLTSARRQGVLTNAMYDNWWNGGNRTTPQRHNMVGLLTESASAKMATPITISRDRLGGATRGFANHKLAVNFPVPWQGGTWRLRDIITDQMICCRSVLTLAARYGSMFQSNYRDMGRDAIRAGEAFPPFGWVIPPNQTDIATAYEMAAILHKTGIEIEHVSAPFTNGTTRIPAGSLLMRSAQPYRRHLKDMMERQVYPDRFNPDGSAEPPYDVAGWTLPLQMGVQTIRLDRPIDAKSERLEVVRAPYGRTEGVGNEKSFSVANESNEVFLLLNALHKKGVPVFVKRGEDGRSERFSFPSTPEASAAIDQVLPRISFIIRRDSESPEGVKLSPRRVGIYQPWVASMDEGWTRLVLERRGFAYTSLHNEDILSGKLRDSFDVILFASSPPRTIREGFRAGQTAPPFVGGLGTKGAAALREFAENGGTLIGLEHASSYLIEELALPVTESLKGLSTRSFYCPGSILQAAIQTDHALTSGISWDLSLYFSRSLAFDLKEPAAGSPAGDPIALVRYGAASPLQSGWLLGPEHIRSKAAEVLVPYGKGNVVLFGFPPQNRGQTHGTFRLLFNALSREISAIQ